MHKKYASQGLVAITLSMDFVRSVKNPVQKGLKKLQERNASLTNLIINEDESLLAEKLRYQGGLPMVYVFNRQGKWKLFDGEINYDTIEKTVQRFLQEK